MGNVLEGHCSSLGFAARVFLNKGGVCLQARATGLSANGRARAQHGGCTMAAPRCTAACRPDTSPGRSPCAPRPQALRAGMARALRPPLQPPARNHLPPRLHQAAACQHLPTYHGQAPRMRLRHRPQQPLGAPGRSRSGRQRRLPRSGCCRTAVGAVSRVVPILPLLTMSPPAALMARRPWKTLRGHQMKSCTPHGSQTLLGLAIQR